MSLQLRSMTAYRGGTSSPERHAVLQRLGAFLYLCAVAVLLLLTSFDAMAQTSVSNVVTIAPPSGVTFASASVLTSTDTDTITPGADLALVKSVGVSTVTAGGSLSFVLAISNAGPSTATAATFADTLPVGLGTVSNVVSQVSGGAITTTFGATVTGISGTLTLRSARR